MTIHDDMRLYTCDTCGAQAVGDPENVAHVFGPHLVHEAHRYTSEQLVPVGVVAEWLNLEMSEDGMRPGTSAVIAGLFLGKFGPKP